MIFHQAKIVNANYSHPVFNSHSRIMKIVYIAHPIGGDVKNNLACLRKIIKEINLTEPDTVPFVPYYADVVSMDDNTPEERERGIKNDIAIIKSGVVQEMRLYGHRLSEGMKAEVMIASKLGIPIVPMNDALASECKIIINRNNVQPQKQAEDNSWIPFVDGDRTMEAVDIEVKFSNGIVCDYLDEWIFDNVTHWRAKTKKQ